jgi:transposase-like protein
MTQLAQVGDFCPNETCPDYGQLQSDQKHNIIQFGRTKQGRQRYKCKSCGKTFTETKGTLFYRRRTVEAEIIGTLAHIAEGNRISSLVRTSGHKQDTISDWIREAGKHAEAIEEVLLKDYQLERGQIDGLWAYVGNKGEKKLS